MKVKFSLREVSKYRVFSGPYFPVLGLNTEIYAVNLRIQSEHWKIQTRKNSVFGHFSQCLKVSRYFSWYHFEMQFIIFQSPGNQYQTLFSKQKSFLS